MKTKLFILSSILLIVVAFQQALLADRQTKLLKKDIDNYINSYVEFKTDSNKLIN